MGERKCAACGTDLATPARREGAAGRPARYCSNACRQRAFRRRSGTRPDASPRVPDRFVGRRAELAALRRHLRDARLVTITGPAGVGKTRTARELTRSAGDGPVHWVLLDSVRNPAALVAAVGAALGVDGRRLPVLDAVVDRLSARRTVLVVDNCEHLSVACAELIVLLLSRCPRLRVLATGREPLGLPDEVVVRLGVLPLPDPQRPPGKAAVLAADAVRLFVDRAQARAPGFAVTEENAAVVTAICRRLDGLPLAIELAARQVGAVPPAAVLAGLTDQLDLLAEGTRAGPARHRELRATMAWSYRLLTAGERLVFRRISVLEGEFDAALARVVVDEPATSAATVTRVLRSLEAKSLVQRSAGGSTGARYRLLNTVRAYGVERLAGHGELAATRDRLAGRLAEIAVPTASSLFFGGSASVALLRERDNLAAAVEHTATRPGGRHTVLAVALARMWWHLHQNADGVALLRRAIALDPGRSDEHHCDALATLAWLTALQHDYPGALAIARDAVELARRRGTPAQLSRSLDVLGRIHLFLDRLGAGADAYRGCVRHCAPQDLPMCLRNLAWALVLAGEREEAADLVARALTATDVVLSLRMRGALLHTCGLLHLLDGDVDRAESAFAGALKATATHGYYAAYSVEALAWVAARRGDHYRAAILVAGADAGREALGLDSEPVWRRHVRAVADEAATVLGPTRTAAALTYGRNLKPDHLVALALHAHGWGDPGNAAHDSLTDREQQVVALIAAGLTTAEIARALRISASTVKTHLAGVRTRLGLRSRTQIAVWYAAVRQVS